MKTKILGGVLVPAAALLPPGCEPEEGFICDAALAGLEMVAAVPLPWSLFFTIGCITAHVVLP